MQAHDNVRWAPIRAAAPPEHPTCAVEAGQGDSRQFLAAAQGAQEEGPDGGSHAGDAGADGRRPERLLVPGQQVTGEAEAEHQQQQEDAGDPGHFPGELVAAGEDHPQQMQHRQDHHGAGAPMVKASNEPPGGDLGRDELDAVVRVIGGRHVVHRQQDSGHDLIDGDEQGGAAEGVQPVDLGDLAQKDRLPGLAPAEALIEPISDAGSHLSLPECKAGRPRP
jgi:hypothetical protein